MLFSVMFLKSVHEVDSEQIDDEPKCCIEAEIN